MSRLFILTRPSLVSGFHLAGVDAYGARDVESAQNMIEKWIATGEVGLLAIDDGLLELMDTDFKRRLDLSENVPYLAIPGGKPLGPEAYEKNRIASLIRKAIGFHIVFKGQKKGQ